MIGSLCELLDGLVPVDLATLDQQAELHTRKDRKYIVEPATLVRVLHAVPEPLQVLQVDGRRWSDYESIYFDTPELDSFRQAARRRPRRFKVRTRSYLDQGVTMLEVKTRDGRGRTIKDRMPYGGDAVDVVGAVRAHAAGYDDVAVHAGALTPTLITRYKRATILLPDSAVRVTIDLGYRAMDRDGRWAELRGELIVETKTAGHASVLDRCLWAAGQRPVAISKYATALAAMRPELPSNAWHRVLQRHFRLRPGDSRDLSSWSDQLQVSMCCRGDISSM